MNFYFAVVKGYHGKGIVAQNAYMSSEAYTDGSAFGNSRRNKHARAGVGVWFGDNDPLNVSENLLDCFDGPSTSSRAELAACIRAIEQWRRGPGRSAGAVLLIHTDSSYVYNTVTQWAERWAARGWLKSNGAPVENQDLVKRLFSLARKYDVRFNKVPAHVGLHGNEMADKLARRGAGERQTDNNEEATPTLHLGPRAHGFKTETAHDILELDTRKGNVREDVFVVDTSGPSTTSENHVFWF